MITACCLFPGTCLAQGQVEYKYFYGKVLNAETKKGIPGVNLSVENSRIGTVSGKQGEFSFFIDSLPANLLVSHIGFETKSALLDATSFSLTLYLNRKAKELPEVEIKSGGVEPVLKDEHYAVLDYETDSNMVYLLVYKQLISRTKLVCLTAFGDTVALIDPYPFKPVQLFRDCLGNMHVLSHDSGFQVFRDGKHLELIYPVNLKKFDDVLKNCVASSPGILFFQKPTGHGMGVEFYGVNRKTMVKSNIARVSDEERLKMLRRNPDDAMLLGRAIQPDGRDDFVTWNYVQKILYRPLKTMLYRVGEFTCVVNTPEKQIEFYDDAGNYSYKMAIHSERVREGRWTEEVMVDGATGRIYTSFLQNGICHIYAIDRNNGTLKKRVSLIHLYPQKIRINDGFIFYLYDDSATPDNKKLFRQRF